MPEELTPIGEVSRSCDGSRLERLTSAPRISELARPRFAGPGCLAVHRDPVIRPGSRPPAGFHPSRDTAGPVCRRCDQGGPLPRPGSAGSLMAVTAYVTAIFFARPLDELARCSPTALRFRALRSSQIVTPATHHARSRAA